MNSLYSCAASVLLWAITSAGRIQVEAMQQELHDHYKCRMKELELL